MAAKLRSWLNDYTLSEETAWIMIDRERNYNSNNYAHNHHDSKVIEDPIKKFIIPHDATALKFLDAVPADYKSDNAESAHVLHHLQLSTDTVQAYASKYFHTYCLSNASIFSASQ